MASIFKLILYRYYKIRQGFPKSFQELKAWIVLSTGILPMLIFGLLCILFFRTGSAGAILVGLTIVSQAILQIWPLSGFIGGRKSYAQIEYEILNPDIKNRIVFSGFSSLSLNIDKYLKLIATEHELNFGPENESIGWVKQLTISRVFLSLEWCIVICAVIGTLVWAYAPA